MAASLAACSLRSKARRSVPDEPADKLYNEGLYLLNSKKDYKDAAKKFEEVDRQHPYSEWARKSLIMSAYAYYQAGDYDDSINAARRYITLHPGSPDAAYAQFLIGSSYFDQIRRRHARPGAHREGGGSARGGGPQISRTPNTPSPPSARSRSRATSSPARRWTIGRYYMNKRDYTGAINRFKVVVTRYQTTRHVEEALLRLTEAYMSLGIVDEAQTAAAVLGHNFPDSRWYKDAYSSGAAAGPAARARTRAPGSARRSSKLGLG